MTESYRVCFDWSEVISDNQKQISKHRYESLYAVSTYIRIVYLACIMCVLIACNVGDNLTVYLYGCVGLAFRVNHDALIWVAHNYPTLVLDKSPFLKATRMSTHGSAQGSLSNVPIMKWNKVKGGNTCRLRGQSLALFTSLEVWRQMFRLVEHAIVVNVGAFFRGCMMQRNNRDLRLEISRTDERMWSQTFWSQ